MSDQIRIEALVPRPLPDLRRVSLILRVSGLPAFGPGSGSSFIQFSDMPQPKSRAQEAKSHQPLSVPNVDLSPEVEAFNQPPSGIQLRGGDERPPSPYPDVNLSILDEHENEIATTYIVEHKEPELDFTLHLTTATPGETYVARAEMTWDDEVIQTVRVPFELTARA